jgi:hypothetical protein
MLYVLAATGATPTCAQSVDPVLFERTGVFAAKGLKESSGVAASRQHQDLLWTHNDSGDEPVIYATNLTGEDLGAVRLAGVDATDWEDIGLGPCVEGNGDCLYVADTGDNLEQRPHAVIYILPEPDPVAARQLPSVNPRTLRVRYPDRPHDVEALAVTPQGDIYLVTKGRTGPIQIFRVGPEAQQHDTATALQVGTLALAPLRRVGQVITGAAVSPSGERFVTRTYTQLFFYRRSTKGEFVRHGYPCWLGLQEPQGEGVDFLDENALVLTSESALSQPGTISRVRCPLPPDD